MPPNLHYGLTYLQWIDFIWHLPLVTLSAAVSGGVLGLHCSNFLQQVVCDPERDAQEQTGALSQPGAPVMRVFRPE